MSLFTRQPAKPRPEPRLFAIIEQLGYAEVVIGQQTAVEAMAGLVVGRTKDGDDVDTAWLDVIHGGVRFTARVAAIKALCVQP